MQEAVRLSDVRQCLRVTQMRVGVHQADLATKERSALGTLKNALRAAVVRHRPVEQAHAICSAQVGADQTEVRAGLLRREHVLENCMDHGQCAVPYTGHLILRMQDVAHPTALFEVRVAGQYAIHDEQPLKIPLHRLRPALEPGDFLRVPEQAQRALEGLQCLEVQRRGPGAAEALAQCRIGRLQGIIPVSVPVGGQCRARNDALFNHGQGALEVLPDSCACGCIRAARIEECDSLIQDARIARGNEILRQHEDRPQDDVPM